MKGIVLAGGTATRLFPLTIVTNKHLLPIYDRPMIYYPIETLAGMGIREVMVVVGGKSVGDVVELLADGAHFGLDLTYRFQRGALGIAHAIGLARNFVGNEAFCVVLGDNILRGPELNDVVREFETGPYDAGTLLFRVPDPERFGVAELDATGNVVGFEEKPQHPKSNLIPIGVYFLRPDAFDVIDRLAPSGRGEFEITDVLNHYIPARRLFTKVYEGHWTDAGTVPSLLRAAELASRDAADGTLRAAHAATGRAMSGSAPRRLLVTGGAGFIGSCFVRDILARHDGTIITVLDKLTYAGNRSSLAVVEADPGTASRFRFVQGDIADPDVVEPLVEAADGVVNFAAESHVDRSILDPDVFLRTGVLGVHVLLEACRRQQVRAATGQRPQVPRLVQVSTDEVYSSVETGQSTETDALEPRSPYSAAKAAGELLVRSYFATYGLDVMVTRGSNTFGPYQHPEKLIPLFLSNAIDDQPLPLYGDGLQRRDWLYVSDHAGAVEFVLRNGVAGEIYNIPGEAELPNREVVAELLRQLGKPWSLVRRVEDRPGHDRRYAMDGSKLRALGWRNRVGFPEGLADTVAWYRANEAWWRAIKAGEWDAYYARQYETRIAGGVAVAETLRPDAGPPA